MNSNTDKHYTMNTSGIDWKFAAWFFGVQLLFVAGICIEKLVA